MLRDNLEIIQEAFLNYKGSGMYMALFFVALLYIFLTEKNKNNKTFLLYFSCFVLLIIINPIFNKCINHFLNKNVYWRTFWMLPIGIVIAYAGTSLIKNISNRKEKIIVFFAVIFMIMTSGKLIYCSENYQKVNNFYKVPDEYVEVVNILSGMTLENKKVMTSIGMVPYIRQIDASIKLAFPRRAYSDYEKYEIIDYYNTGNIEKLTNLCKEKKVNIIVFDKSLNKSMPLTYFDFEWYAQTEHYEIYIQKKPE